MWFKYKQTWQSLKRYMFKELGFSKEGERRVRDGYSCSTNSARRKESHRKVLTFIYSFIIPLHSVMHSFIHFHSYQNSRKKFTLNCCSVVVPYALMTSQLHRLPGTQPDAADAPIAFVIGMLRGIPFSPNSFLLRILSPALGSNPDAWTILSII